MRYNDDGTPVTNYSIPMRPLVMPPVQGNVMTGEHMKQWGHYIKAVQDDGSYLALMLCPECGTPQVLQGPIDQYGVVFQPVICATAGCPFARFIVLNHWEKLIGSDYKIFLPAKLDPKPPV